MALLQMVRAVSSRLTSWLQAAAYQAFKGKPRGADSGEAAIGGLLGRARRRIRNSQQRSESCCSQKRSHGYLPFCEMALQPSNTSRFAKFRLCYGQHARFIDLLRARNIPA